MNQIINFSLEWLNNVGQWFWDFSAGMFIQVSLLIIVLLAVDFLLRKRVRAVFRYCLWMLVFVKLILPPTFSLPTSIGYWYGDYLSNDLPVLQQVSKMVRPEPAGAPALEDFMPSTDNPRVQPSETISETTAPVTFAVSGLNPLTWQAVVFGLWLVGVLVISVLLIQRMSFVKGLIARSEPAKNRLVDMLNQCRRQVGVRRSIELRLSNSISSPAVCGLFKPVILIPTALLEKLSPDKLRTILIHELVHIKRADIWVSLVQTVLQIIYFYNPFVWFANAVVRRIREQAVDETVLVALGAGTKSYSNTLIDIAEMAFWKTSLSLRLIGVVESKKALHRRIRHMLNRPIPKSAKVGAVGTIVIIIIAAVLLPMAKAEKKGLEVAETGQVHGQFAVTLSDGVIVELVGLGKKPWEAEQQWWRPDGVEIEKPEYKRSGAPFKWPTNPNGLQFQCATLFKFSNHQGKNVSVPEVRFSKKFLQAGLTSGIAADETQITYIVRPPNKGVFAQQVYQKTDILLAIGSVPFKKVKTPSKKFNEKMHETYFLEDNSEVIRHPLRVDHYLDTLTVDLTCPEGDFEFRVLAELKNGQTEQWHGGSVGKKVRFFHATPRRKNIKVEDIEQLIIEYRPYDWVTFRNVSLQPGFKTDVQVKIGSEKPAGQVEVEGGAGKQLSREQKELLERRRANRQSLSYKNMQKLGLAVAVFANDHKGRCPSNLLDLRKYIADAQIFDWINRNVVYLGRNHQYRAPPDAVLAYDESMLKKPRQETNVLYNDAHVALVSSKWLKEIGIRLER